jgi:hypothetical protein
VCSLTRQACPHPSFKNASAGWETRLRCTSVIQKAIQDKHLAALQSASSNVMALIGTPPDDIVHSTATMSDLNAPNDIVEDNQLGAYIDEMD